MSYTEVVVEDEVISMGYHTGSPCEFREEAGFGSSVHLNRPPSVLGDRS